MLESLSSGTGRLVPPKIKVTCPCGKKYRVPADKAGKKIRCKNCRVKLTVPGDKRKISMRSRKAILQEFGIDADAAEKAWEEESKKAGYNCTMCQVKISEDHLASAYGEHGLVCSRCRNPSPSDYDQPIEVEKTEQQKREEQLDHWTRMQMVRAVQRKVAMYAGLFLVGITGFIYTFGSLIFGMSFGASFALALLVTGIGAYSVFKSEYIPPVIEEDDDL